VTDERHRRIKEVFLEASQLEGEPRRQLVEHRCGDDTAMRREVELLLAHHKSNTIIPVAAARGGSSSKSDVVLAGKSRSQSSRSRGKTAWSRALNLWAERLTTSGQMALGAALVLLISLGLAMWSQFSIAESSRNYWRNGFASMLKSTAENLTAWFDAERYAVDAWSADPNFRRYINDALAPEADAGAEPVADAGQKLTEAVSLRWRKDAVSIVWDAEGKVRTGNAPAEAGFAPFAAGERFRRALAGESQVLLPQDVEPFAGPDWCGANRPLMGVLAPLRDATKTVGVIFVGSPSMITEFTQRLNSITLLGSGDAFAFDKTGRMITESRYTDQLAAAGVVNGEHPTTVLMPIRDPGQDLTRRSETEIPYAANLPTMAVARAIGGIDGVEVDGYRDYRGVEVIGGWRWLPEHNFGMVIKLDLDEAYDQLDNLRIVFITRMVMMLGIVALLLYSWRSSVLLRRRVAETPRIGPYVLDVAIGEGGMGRVYRAHHALLKRPTAVKIIKPELVTEQTKAWFEREVTLAGKLTHPNTIEIYDFGSTGEGQFYCAMELLRGLTLSQVLLIEGKLPLARALHVLRQTAASLAEAHEIGLVHRDIKLHNVMLCFLGGEADFVKVLDFGLAKQSEGAGAESHTASSFNIAGTPLFMAPERLKPPYACDARCDVYSLGVVAFKLLTGRDLFTAQSDLEMFNHALYSVPQRASESLGEAIPAELDELIFHCLAKSPNDRPRDAAEVVEVLDTLCGRHPWRQSDAQAWWLANSHRIRELVPDWDPRNCSGLLRSAATRAGQMKLGSRT
jgi:hypothetical protein